MNTYFNNSDDNLNNEEQGSPYGGDTTGAMIDAILATEEATGVSSLVLNQLRQMKDNLVGYLDQPFTTVPQEQKWQIVLHLNGVGGVCLICQGRILEHLFLDYHGDRKRFLDDCNRYARIKQQAVDDRRRVYRVLNQVLSAHGLTFTTATEYIDRVTYTLWRVLTEQKWTGRWEWRDGKVYLTAPASGAGHELSEYVGGRGEKSDALLRRALMEPAHDEPGDDDEQESDESNGIVPALTTSADINTWDMIGNDDVPDRQVRGVNVAPSGDDNNTDFHETEPSFSAWYEFYCSNQGIMGRKVHFYDPHLEHWSVFDLPDVTEQEVVR